MNTVVSEDDLAPARIDPAFRQQLLAVNLDRLLTALNTMRQGKIASPETARQIREDVDLAVKLADRLATVRQSGPACSVITGPPCLFRKNPYKPRAPSILVGS